MAEGRLGRWVFSRLWPLVEILKADRYGGIPYGDKNEEIYLTTCEPANSTSIPVKPKWGPVFTVSYYNEVLIGHKTDPFCYQCPSIELDGWSGVEAREATDGFETSEIDGRALWYGGAAATFSQVRSASLRVAPLENWKLENGGVPLLRFVPWQCSWCRKGRLLIILW